MMKLWLIGIGLIVRSLLFFFKSPFPEHYNIISLSPQYNATKALEVVYQRALNVQNVPLNAGCYVIFG